MNIKLTIVKIYFLLKNIFDVIFGVFLTSKYFNNSSLPTAFLIGTPEHDNLGDHAIALAELQFIKLYFSNYNIIEISVESWRKYKINLQYKIKRNDIFFLTGGGNMGNIYLSDEKLRRYIISHYIDNPVVIFPQTIYFTPDERGKKELIHSSNMYNSHTNLLICAREFKSYEIMKYNFNKCNIYLCPDMVFMLKIDFNKRESSNKIGLCIRSDRESISSRINYNNLLNEIKNTYNIESFTTCHNTKVKFGDRIQLLSNVLEKLSQFDFVVTDRLHAMIFSVLSETFCIALPSESHKIVSTIDIINNSDKVLLFRNDLQLSDIIKYRNIDNAIKINKFDSYYTTLAKKIKELIIQ